MRKEETREQFEMALKDVASNLLHIVVGYGQPNSFLDQLWACWETAEDFRLAHSHYPAPREIQNLLLSLQLTPSETDRAYHILLCSAKAALNRLEESHRYGVLTHWNAQAQASFSEAVLKSCDKIIQAVRPKLADVEQQKNMKLNERLRAKH
jgi:hypothetical protein